MRHSGPVDGLDHSPSDAARLLHTSRAPAWLAAAYGLSVLPALRSTRSLRSLQFQRHQDSRPDHSHRTHLLVCSTRPGLRPGSSAYGLSVLPDSQLINPVVAVPTALERHSRTIARPRSQSIGLTCSSSAPHVQGSGLAPRPTASQSYRTLSSSTRSLRSLQLPATPGQARPRSQSIGLTCSSSAPHVQGSGLAPRPTASQSYRTLSSSTRSLRSLQLPATPGQARPRSQSIGLTCSSSAPHVQGSGLAPRPTASQSYRTLSSSTRSLRSLQLPATPGQARPRSQSIGLTCSSSAPHVQGSGLAPRPTASQSYRTLSSSTRSLRSLQLPATPGQARPRSQSIGLTCSSSAPHVQGSGLAPRPTASQSYRTLSSSTRSLRSLQLQRHQDKHGLDHSPSDSPAARLLHTSRAPAWLLGLRPLSPTGLSAHQPGRCGPYSPATPGQARPRSQSIGLTCSSSAPHVQGSGLAPRPTASQSYRTLSSSTRSLRSLQLPATPGQARPRSQSIGLTCSSSAPHVQGSGLAPRPTASQSYRTLSSSTRSLRSLQLPATPGQARPRSQSIGLTCSSSAPHVQGSGLAPRPTASQSYRTLSSSTRSLRSLQLPATPGQARPRSQSIGLTCSSSAPHVQGVDLALRPQSRRGCPGAQLGRTLADSYEAVGSMCWAIAPPVFPRWGNGKGERSSRVHKLCCRRATARATFRTEREHGETCAAERSNGSRAEGPSGSRWGAPPPSIQHERSLTTDASSLGVGPALTDAHNPGGAGGSSPVEGEKGAPDGRLGWRRGSVRKCGRRLRSGRKRPFWAEIENPRRFQRLVAAFIRPGGSNPPCVVWNRRDASTRAAPGSVMDGAESRRRALGLASHLSCVSRHTRWNLGGDSCGGGNGRLFWRTEMAGRANGRARTRSRGGSCGAAAKAGEWPLAASCYRLAVGTGWLQVGGNPRTGGIGHVGEQDGGMAVLAFQDADATLLREVAAGAVGADVHDVSDLHVEGIH